MDIFRFNKALNSFLEPCSTDEEIDIHFRYITELCRQNDDPMDIAWQLLHAAHVTVYAHDPELVATDFRDKLHVISEAARYCDQKSKMRAATKKIEA